MIAEDDNEGKEISSQLCGRRIAYAALVFLVSVLNVSRFTTNFSTAFLDGGISLGVHTALDGNESVHTNESLKSNRTSSSHLNLIPQNTFNQTLSEDKDRNVSVPLGLDVAPILNATNGSAVREEHSTLSDSAWIKALQETTKLIYKSSAPKKLEYWMTQPPPVVYIYDTIPKEFSDVATVSHCVERKFLGENNSKTWANCPWRPEPCQDTLRGTATKPKMFMSSRYNYNIDVAYIDKFHRYPFVTKNPKEADLFVVPYPHKSHCLCNKNFRLYSARCAVPFSEIQKNVLDRLVHYHKNQDLRRRHIFFPGADWMQEPKPFREAFYSSISLGLGPVMPCTSKNSSCGHIAAPYLTTDPAYQPDIMSATNDEGWITRTRQISVGAALSAPKALALRGEFLKKWEKWIGKSIHGKPNVVVNMGTQRTGKKSQFYMDLYHNSTVCIILPGDGCAQKRFFDTLLNGCVPMVPLFDSNDFRAPYSFHHQKGCSTRVTYPFSQGSFFDDPDAGFNIMDIVVTYNATCGLGCMKPALEAFLSNQTLVEEKRRKLRQYASLISFGLTSSSDPLPDAFMGLIVQLRHHIWHVKKRVPALDEN